MTDESMNSAERAAEEILKAEADKAQAEKCPQGAECPVHFRNDEDYVDSEVKYARMITYVGEFAVVTDDSAEVANPIVALSLILKGQKAPRYETVVYHVGDGVLADLILVSPEAVRKATRHLEKHDSWDGLRDHHQLVVTAVREGFIDLSKGVDG